MNQRLSCFSWRLLHRRNQTDGNAQRSGVSLCSRCSLCSLVATHRPPLCFTSTSMLCNSLTNSCDRAAKQSIAMIFFVTVQALQKFKNKILFEGKRPPLISAKMLLWIQLKSALDQSPKPFLCQTLTYIHHFFGSLYSIVIILFYFWLLLYPVELSSLLLFVVVFLGAVLQLFLPPLNLPFSLQEKKLHART